MGQGPDIDTVHRALVASHSHYVNMIDTEVTSMGIGVVTSGNTVFIVENFVGRAGAATAKVTTTKAPAPPTTGRQDCAPPSPPRRRRRPSRRPPPRVPATVPVAGRHAGGRRLAVDDPRHRGDTDLGAGQRVREGPSG